MGFKKKNKICMPKTLIHLLSRRFRYFFFKPKSFGRWTSNVRGDFNPDIFIRRTSKPIGEGSARYVRFRRRVTYSLVCCKSPRPTVDKWSVVRAALRRPNWPKTTAALSSCSTIWKTPRPPWTSPPACTPANIQHASQCVVNRYISRSGGASYLFLHLRRHVQIVFPRIRYGQVQNVFPRLAPHVS